MRIFQNKKAQWAHAIARENRSIARGNRILLTSYLMEKGHTDPYELARFWGVSVNTVKTYMKEAEYVNLSEEGRNELKAIQERENCDLPDAIANHYNELTNPKSGCFIATAAYGTPFAKEIDILRYWRDAHLKTNFLGKLFVKFYYIVSPPIADFIRPRKRLRRFVRCVLNPLVKLLNRKK